MEKVMAFVGWVWDKVKGLFGWLMTFPKRWLCWLHDKFCGC